MNLQKLIETIEYTVRKTVREEIKMALNEMAKVKVQPNQPTPTSKAPQPLPVKKTPTHKFHENVKFNAPSKLDKYSSNSLLNDLLKSTVPLSGQELGESDFGIMEDKITITQDVNGRPINPNSKGVKLLEDVMNRDYSGMISNGVTPELRNKMKSLVMDETPSFGGVEEEEDLSWLNQY